MPIPRIPGEQWHAHLSPGEGTASIHLDGSWTHGPGALSAEQADFLRRAGWNI